MKVFELIEKLQKLDALIHNKNTKEQNMYCTTNYRTKKALKDATQRRNDLCDAKLWALQHPGSSVGFNEEDQRKLDRLSARLTVFQPNDMFDNPKARPDYSGSASIEGPHYPEPQRWYATVEIKDGVIVKVK